MKYDEMGMHYTKKMITGLVGLRKKAYNIFNKSHAKHIRFPTPFDVMFCILATFDNNVISMVVCKSHRLVVNFVKANGKLCQIYKTNDQH